MVLGDREFCSIELANWLREKGLCFCSRLKGSTCLETEPGTWKALKNLGLTPGMSLYSGELEFGKLDPSLALMSLVDGKENIEINK